MITDHDRSGWFGASDVGFIVGNWKTQTFEKWWRQKLGYNTDHFDNRFTLAGTHWEHKILESLTIPGMRLDEQIRMEDILLRVNFDGMTDDCIYECKTFQAVNGWKMPKKYKQQVWVQMYASGIRKAYVVAYGLEEADYDNYFRPVDPLRLILEEVQYDERWVAEVFLPRLRVLAHCLRNGLFPREEMLNGSY